VYRPITYIERRSVLYHAGSNIHVGPSKNTHNRKCKFSAVTDEPRDALVHLMCCKHRWTLSVINCQTKLITLATSCGEKAKSRLS